MPVQRGCLLLADISGYSRYMSGVELEHSHDILADLLSTVVAQLSQALTFAKLEGDAVFCYDIDPQDPPQEPPDLASLVENCYYAFRRRVRNISHLTTCNCDACTLVPRLGLKVMVHHGEFMLHEVIGQKELLGPEVITAHRLLKNTVTSSLGFRDYALFSSACVSRFAMDPEAMGLMPHSERYEDVGEITVFVEDLEAKWHAEEERLHSYIPQGAAMLEVSGDISADVATVWEWITSPHKRPLWQSATVRVDPQDPSLPMGAGSLNHCVHGDYTVREEILDWRPHHYYSTKWDSPAGQLLGTIEVAALDGGGTRVWYRMHPTGGPEAEVAFAELVPSMRPGYVENLAALDAVLAQSAERARAGTSTPRSSS